MSRSPGYPRLWVLRLAWLLPMLLAVAGIPSAEARAIQASSRSRIRLGDGWRFSRFTENPDGLSYSVLKPWMLASANKFIVSGAQYERPADPPAGSAIYASYAQPSFDDSAWDAVRVPHDWAIEGPFLAPNVSGGMGRLPSNGIGWYRRALSLDVKVLTGKSVFLDVDGSMSYTAVWLNGHLVGGWPYGYASFRLDLTPYVKAGSDNLLAIRVDNALENSRWYPGAGIYRDLWLVTVDTVHVDQFGTKITTPSIAADKATADLTVQVENTGSTSRKVDVRTDVHVWDARTGSAASGAPVASFPKSSITVAANASASVQGSVAIANPKLWGPVPDQVPNLYVAVTTLTVNGAVVDTYETRFGIRSVTYSGDSGLLVNGKRVRVQGTNNHHDLGALGAALHQRALERQFDVLQDLGCNALRTSHNPPAPQLLELADERGLLVLDEIFDCWNRAKTTNDFHLIFPEWHEPDLRAFLRRDRNHPSVVVWSYGNEIGEQTSDSSRAVAQELHDIVHAEDPTRPSTASMNAAWASTAFAEVMDVESLNYQGEGQGTTWASSFPSFHAAYPDKLLWTTESASALSTRGTYIFPVTPEDSATVGGASAGGDPRHLYVSAYELYAPAWGSSPDKVFAVQDEYPYVAGEFVWTGFDYLGEPTPYDEINAEGVAARSSYFGIVDLAGFPKDRFYLYQARWRPDLPVAHILPHWSWPADRVGAVTPVHVFAAADEAELFVNGRSAGRRQPNGTSSYRFRWDDVTYAPGTLRVETYRDGRLWAVDTKKTVGPAARLTLAADTATLRRDDGGDRDLAFLTAAVVDAHGETVPSANNTITFSIAGGGARGAEIAATDNGDPTDLTVFSSPTRNAFSGLALGIVRAKAGGKAGQKVTVLASAPGLKGASVTLTLT